METLSFLAWADVSPCLTLFADILKFVSIFTNGVAAFPVTSMSGFGIRAMLAFRQGFQFSGNSGSVYMELASSLL